MSDVLAPVPLPEGLDPAAADGHQTPGRSRLAMRHERHPEKLSGAWVFRGTLVSLSARCENLRDGASIEQFLAWFPGVQCAQVEAVLEHEAIAAAHPDTAGEFSLIKGHQFPSAGIYGMEPTAESLRCSFRQRLLSGVRINNAGPHEYL